MSTTHESIVHLKDRLRTDARLRSSLDDALAFLQASEYLLVQLMVANHLWRGPLPPPPAGKGDVEFGLVPYWVNNPPVFVQDFLAEHPLFAIAWKALDVLLPTHIDADNYARLLAAAQAQGVVAADGTIFGVNRYEGLDPEWLWALVNYLYVVTTDDRAPFPSTMLPPVPLAGGQPGQVTLALMGDWGTGAYEGGQAQAVMAQIVSHAPDYIVHLGDVYYAGTNASFQPSNEELDNFLALWPGLPSFMLNSNHEMYSGAKGYFDVLQRSPSPFSLQKESSYFALQFGGWTLLGLDSAYWATSPMFMTGDFGGTDGVQARWIRTLTMNGRPLDPARVIVLTHHNALAFDGRSEETLAADLNAILGGDPAAWYWGHVHNGIAYKAPTVTHRPTLSRCVGHGAVPYGKAYGLIDDESVDYWAQTVNRAIAGNSIRLCNGFALLTLTGQGTVTEQFFEQNMAQAVFSNRFG